MGPNLESCALTRGKCAYVAALISQALIDKLRIIERYNHRTKRCCVLSQDDGTSSSDRRAIECPKAGNVRKTRPTAGHPGHKIWQMPATAHPQADDPVVRLCDVHPSGESLR